MKNFWLLSAATILSCGTGAPEIPPELIPSGGGGAPADLYPPGPYGTNEGDTLRDLEFEGYPTPDSEQKLELIRLGDFYDPQGDKGYQLLLLNTAAAWCQPCRIEHADLPNRLEEYGPQGLVAFSLLYQNNNGEPPDETTLKTWTDSFGINFPMALDPSYQMGLYGPAETPPLNLIVDPRDMRLLKRFIGNQEGPMWAFIEAELAARQED
ncbi:MAG: redoxin domain-containing protein [Polyangiaceae bacterium]|nr:redoxin domain-containing protein [Polyangiaceae bacterium]